MKKETEREQVMESWCEHTKGDSKKTFKFDVNVVKITRIHVDRNKIGRVPVVQVESLSDVIQCVPV